MMTKILKKNQFSIALIIQYRLGFPKNTFSLEEKAYRFIQEPDKPKQTLTQP